VYYRLEPSGKEYLRTLVREYKDITQGVFNIIERGEANHG